MKPKSKKNNESKVKDAAVKKVAKPKKANKKKGNFKKAAKAEEPKIFLLKAHAPTNVLNLLLAAKVSKNRSAAMNGIQMLFKKPRRDSKFTALAEKGYEVLHKASGSELEPILGEDDQSKYRRAFHIIQMCCTIITNICRKADEDELIFYKTCEADIAKLLKKKKIDVDVVIELFLVLLPHTGQVNRTLAYYLASAFSPLFTSEHVFRLLEIAIRSDEHIFDGEEDIADDDFTPITEAELANLKMTKENLNSEMMEVDDDSDDEEEQNAAEDEEQDNDEESSDSDDDDDNAAPDQEMVVALKKALGSVAATGSDDEDMPWDDAHLENLDKAIVHAMRSFTAIGRREQRMAAQVFRSNLCSIIEIMIKSFASNVLVEVVSGLGPILLAAEESDQATEALTMVAASLEPSRIKESSSETTKLAITTLDAFLVIAANIHRGQLKPVLETFGALLFKPIALSAESKIGKASISSTSDTFSKYFASTERSAVCSIAHGIISRNKELFVSLMPKVFKAYVGAARSKKGELAEILLLFNQSDLAEKHAKVYEKIASLIMKHFDPEEEITVQKNAVKQAFKLFMTKTASMRL